MRRDLSIEQWPLRKKVPREQSVRGALPRRGTPSYPTPHMVGETMPNSAIQHGPVRVFAISKVFDRGKPLTGRQKPH